MQNLVSSGPSDMLPPIRVVKIQSLPTASRVPSLARGLKGLFAGFLVCLLAEGIAIVAVMFWWSTTYVEKPIGALPGWPAIALARYGLSVTWPIVPSLLLAMAGGVALMLRRRRWPVRAAVAAILGLGFCEIGHWQTGRLYEAQPASNPYPNASTNSVAYVNGYSRGFVRAATGALGIDICFAPEAEIQGFQQGMVDGGAVWSRAVGRLLPTQADYQRSDSTPRRPR